MHGCIVVCLFVWMHDVCRQVGRISCMHVCKHVCMHACMLACLHACIHVNVFMRDVYRMLACLCMSIHLCARVRAWW